MADYYPAISRAVAALNKKSEKAREEVYDRARAALADQLKKVDPPLSENDVFDEWRALQDAIDKVEAETTHAKHIKEQRDRRLLWFWFWLILTVPQIGNLCYYLVGNRPSLGGTLFFGGGAIFFSIMTIVLYLSIRYEWSDEQIDRVVERIFGAILLPPIILVGIVIAGVALYSMFGWLATIPSWAGVIIVLLFLIYLKK